LKVEQPRRAAKKRSYERFSQGSSYNGSSNGDAELLEEFEHDEKKFKSGSLIQIDLQAIRAA